MKPKKPMTDKQANAIKAVHAVLGIEYKGPETAQGAFLFLREHIDNARKVVARQIKAERVYLPGPVNPHFRGGESAAMKAMSFYRYDDAQNPGAMEDEEDHTYAETPTRESLGRDIAYWSMFL